MTHVQEYKVGDVIQGSDAPVALLRDDHGNYAIKVPDWAFWVHLVGNRDDEWWDATQERWNPAQLGRHVTIVAFITGEEAPADLRRLAERYEAAQTYVDAVLGGQLSSETVDAHLERCDRCWKVLDVEGVALAESLLSTRWYRRDDHRRASRLEPDGLWNAALLCGTTIAGIEARERGAAMARHRDHCLSCRLLAEDASRS